MGRGDENSRGTGSNGVPMEGVKFASQLGGNNRRRLRDIGNMVSAQPYPSAACKSKVPMDHKNPQNFVGRRPMTRKFAASLEGKSQACHEDSSARQEHVVSVQKPTSSVLGLNGSDDDHYELPDDFPLPMIEEIEEMVNCELKEVEMEDLEVEPLMDIDGCDSSNPLAVADYVEDIYSFYRQTEDLGCVCPNYMSIQFDINEKMRAILIDWLIEVHYKFELMDETLFLTVNIIDRFLARQTVVRKKLQLVGVTAMLLACKYEEVSVPVVDDFILISDRAYTKGEVLEMERLMVNTLQFNMSLPTPYVFMRRFFKAAQSNKEVELLSFFIIELCLVEFQMLKFRPSLLAAAAIYTAQCALKGFKYWSRTSELHASYSEDQLLECSRMMVDFHQKAGVGKLTGVHRKYSTFRFGYAAKTEPALFLLETGL